LYGVHQKKKKENKLVAVIEGIVVDHDVVDVTSLGTMEIIGTYSTPGVLTTHVLTMLLKGVEETITMNRAMNQSITDA
jgi:hypothetical protein